jgi:hypothetical protein
MLHLRDSLFISFPLSAQHPHFADHPSLGSPIIHIAIIKDNTSALETSLVTRQPDKSGLRGHLGTAMKTVQAMSDCR